MAPRILKAFHSNRNKSLILFFTSEFFISFSVFGLLTVMMLFLTQNGGLNQKNASELMGNFTSLAYIFSFVGGTIGGRYLGYRALSLAGLSVLLVGFTILIIYHQPSNISLGLACIGCGNGLLGPNLRNFLGLYYQGDSEPHRDNGFTLLHVFNVLGQFFGPVILGYLKPVVLFSVSSLSVALGLICLALSSWIYPIKSDVRTNTTKENFIGSLIIFFTFLLMLFLLYKQEARILLGFILIVILIVFPIMLVRMERIVRIKSIAILIIWCGTLASDICLRQTLVVNVLFTKQYVNTTLFNFYISPAVFEALEALFVFLAYPVIKKIRKMLQGKSINLDSGFSMAFGLGLFSIGFGVMSLATHLIPAAKISGAWICLFYGILAFGELLIIPIAQAAIVEISPKNWRGFMMGVFFLLVSFASYISGWLGKLISPDSNTIPKKTVYESLFTYNSLSVGFFAALFFIVWKYWSKKYAKELSKQI